MKNIMLRPLITLLFFSLLAVPQTQTSPESIVPAAPVFRDPFTLKLHTQDGDYKEQFERVPYVENNTVYIFAGESFGVRVAIRDEEITGLTYEKDAGKGDVAFKFTQGKGMMLLMIKSKLKHPLYMDAGMAVPRQKGFYKTNILAVGAGLSNFESWPHPIVELVLKNFRFSARPAK